jgi:hypothetical protein
MARLLSSPRRARRRNLGRDAREEALANLEEVVRLVVASLIEHGDDVPAGVVDHAGQGEPLIAVNL